MKSPSLSLGPISLSARTKTQLHVDALSLADKTLSSLSRENPSLAHWRGMFSIVHPVIMPDGSIQWAYSNPRDLELLTCDHGRFSMGTGGYYPSQTIAHSRALSHMIQIHPDGIPLDLPDTLHPDDLDNLVTLRRYQVESALAAKV